jgi:hypothetical protein
LRQQESELSRLDVRVVIITFQGGPLADNYVRDTGLDWPILIDVSRSLYRAYGMERGRLWHIWGPPAWWVYMKLLVRGRRLRKISGDVFQLGGDVLIAPDATIRVHHVGNGPADRPSVAELLAAVRGSLERPAGKG